MPIKGMFIGATLVLASGALTLAAFEVALRLLDKSAWDTALRAGWKYKGRYVNELGYRDSRSAIQIAISLLFCSAIPRSSRRHVRLT
jgi:hypothetical protein